MLVGLIILTWMFVSWACNISFWRFLDVIDNIKSDLGFIAGLTIIYYFFS